LNVRGKNKKERFSGLLKNITKTADEALLLSGQKDSDEYFEHEKSFMNEYHIKIKDSTSKIDKVTKSHKQCANDYLMIASCLQSLATVENSITTSHDLGFDKSLLRVHDTLEKIRKLESRASSDTDLKLSDLLRYYSRDAQACKDLLYRRSRSLANYENTNRDLDKARARGKNIQQAVDQQKLARSKFEALSETGKTELTEFKGRRVTAFRKQLIELGELQLKHSKSMVQALKSCIASIEQL